jgi:hypothetical protein
VVSYQEIAIWSQTTAEKNTFYAIIAPLEFIADTGDFA